MELKKLKQYFQKLRHQLKSRIESSQNVYIVPSQFGLLYLTTLSLSIIISVSFGHPFSYFFSALMFVLFIASLFLSNYYLKSIDISLHSREILIEEGEMYNLKLSIESKNDAIINCELCLGDNKKSYLIKNKKSILSFPISFNEWGEYSDLKLRINSLYPFFLFFTWRFYNLNESILVFPRVSKAEFKKLQDESQHEYSDIEINKYKRGDNLSRVNWKKFSQTGKLYVKQDLGGESNINILEEKVIEKLGEYKE